MGAGYQDRIVIIGEMYFPNSLPWGTFKVVKVVSCHMKLEPKEGTTAYYDHTVRSELEAANVLHRVCRAQYQRESNSSYRNPQRCVREFPVNF